MRVHGPIDARIGESACIDEPVPAGAKQYTVTVCLSTSPNSEAADPGRSVDIVICAAMDPAGLRFYPVMRLPQPWQGGPSAANPTITWPFNTTAPTRVKAYVLSGAGGVPGSAPKVDHVDSAFA